MIVKLALGIVEVPQPSPAFQNKKPYEIPISTILYPYLDTEPMAQFPLHANKKIGGSGTVLRIYNSTTKLPNWDMANPVWPIKINQTFSRRHKGIDLDTEYRHPIYAVNDGEITFAGWDGGYGRFIVVQHEGGWVSRYAHNAQIFVKVGQSVKRGDIIGSSGITGFSSGYHLHFELIYNNEFVNPYKYLKL